MFSLNKTGGVQIAKPSAASIGKTTNNASSNNQFKQNTQLTGTAHNFKPSISNFHPSTNKGTSFGQHGAGNILKSFQKPKQQNSNISSHSKGSTSKLGQIDLQVKCFLYCSIKSDQRKVHIHFCNRY